MHGFYNRYFLSAVVDAGSCQSNVFGGWRSFCSLCEELAPALSSLSLWEKRLNLHMVFPGVFPSSVCTCLSLCVALSCGHASCRTRTLLMTSLYLSHLCKGSISKFTDILRYWGLGLWCGTLGDAVLLMPLPKAKAAARTEAGCFAKVCLSGDRNIAVPQGALS